MRMEFRSVLAASLALFLGLSACTKKASQDPPLTIHVPSIAKIKSLDPAFGEDLYSNDELGKSYEGLLQYHYLKRPYTLIPNLAEALPQVSADGKTYTFKIKKGVVFVDDPCFKETNGKGRELTAEDFVYSFKRLADPHLLSSGFWLVDNKVLGINAWHDEQAKSATTDYSKPVEGLKALDRYTLQIQLSSRNYQFIYYMANPYSYVVPKEAVEAYGKEFGNHAVGTGAFKLVEYNPSSRVVWVKNPTHHAEFYPSEGSPGDKEAGLLDDAGKPLPLVDKFVTEVHEEQQPMWLNFMAGKLDLSGIPKDNYPQAIEGKDRLKPELVAKGIKLRIDPMLDITHTSFNMEDPVLGKNKLLRQAMSLAYDEAKFNELFYNNREIPAQSPISPGLKEYDPNFKNPYRQYDLAKAKELMAKAGFPGGKGLPTFEYFTLSDTFYRQTTEFEQKAFGELGIKINVHTGSWPEFLRATHEKKAQIYAWAWGGDYPDAENFLQLFYSKNVSPGPNDSNYSNPAYDQLYEQALSLPEGEARSAIYLKMRDILVEDCPWIWGVHRINYKVSQKWVFNFKHTEVDHQHWKYLRVDPALKPK